MKKFTIILAFMLFATLTTKATVWTVSNNPVDSSAASFSNLQNAINNATSGDTLYISGSTVTYGTVTIKKKLVCIGAGYKATSTKPSTMLYIIHLDYEKDMYNNITSNPSGSVFCGLDIIQLSTATSVDSLLIRRCKVGIYYKSLQSDMSVNWIIVNNIITTISVNYGTYYNYVYTSNFLVANNIIKGSVYLMNSTFKNNMFLNTFTYVSYCNIFNNIFFGVKPTQGTSNCTFKNNNSYDGGNTSLTVAFTGGSNNVFTNNLQNQDPNFVSAPITNPISFSYSNDYHLQSSSPCIGTGLNATDIGIYGGSFPFPSGGDIPYQTSALPHIPQIMNLQISNPIIPIDSVLHINVKASIHN